MDGRISLDFRPHLLGNRKANREEATPPEYAVIEDNRADDFLFVVRKSPKRCVKIPGDTGLIDLSSAQRNDRGAYEINVFIGLSTDYKCALIHDVSEANLLPTSLHLPRRSCWLSSLGMDMDLARMGDGEAAQIIFRIRGRLGIAAEQTNEPFPNWVESHDEPNATQNDQDGPEKRGHGY